MLILHTLRKITDYTCHEEEKKSTRDFNKFLSDRITWSLKQSDNHKVCAPETPMELTKFRGTSSIRTRLYQLVLLHWQRASWLGVSLYGTAVTPTTTARLSREWWEQQNSLQTTDFQISRTSTGHGAWGKLAESSQTSVTQHTAYSLDYHHAGKLFRSIQSHTSWLKNRFYLQAFRLLKASLSTSPASLSSFIYFWLCYRCCSLALGHFKPNLIQAEEHFLFFPMCILYCALF